MKKIIRYHLRPAVLMLLALSTTHCLDRCAQAPNQDTTNIDLQWEETPCDVSNLPTDLDLFTPLGWICQLPDEGTTYFLDENKPCWKFTQGPNRTLMAQKAADFSIEFFRASSFCFYAGEKKQPGLFFGEVYNFGFGGAENIVVSQLESGTWIAKQTESLAAFFTGYTNLSPDTYITGCTIEKGGQYQGCILFAMPDPGTTQPKLGCLVFNPTTMSFEKIEIDAAYEQSLTTLTSPYVITSMPVAPGKILLAKGQNIAGTPDTYDLLAFDNGQLKPLREGISGPPAVQNANDIHNTYRPNWQPFRMVVDDTIPVTVSILSIVDGDERKFYRMNEKYEFEAMTGLPASASLLKGKNTLFIPFADYCYVIGKPASTDGAQEKPVCYRARIRLVPPPSKK